MKTLIIYETLKTKEDFYNSPILKSLFSGYEHVLPKKQKVWDSSEFLGAHVIMTDPKLNYGRQFKIFRHYKTEEGICLLKEVEISSSVTSAPLELVSVLADRIIFSGSYFPKQTKEDRQFLIDSSKRLINTFY